MDATDKATIRTMIERHALVCAVCLYVLDGGKAKTALTVIEGYAVCDDHLGYVAQGTTFHSIISAARRESAIRTAVTEPPDPNG